MEYKKAYCSNCNKVLALIDNNKNIHLHEEITDVYRHSYYIDVNCYNCEKENNIKGFLDLDSFNNSTLGNTEFGI